MIQLTAFYKKVKQMSLHSNTTEEELEGQRKENDRKRIGWGNLKEDFKMLYEIKETREVTEQTMINKIKRLEETNCWPGKFSGSFWE